MKNKMISLISNSICLNYELECEGKFCSNCGQKASTRRYGEKSLEDDVVDKLKFWDNKVPYTFKEILLNPITVTSNFLKGKRVKYTSPITLLTVVLTCVFWVTKHLNYEIWGDPTEEANLPKTAPYEDKILAKSSDSFGEFYESYSEYLIFLSVFFISIITYFILKKLKLHYGEHFIINTIASIGSGLILIFFYPFLKFSDNNIYVVLLQFVLSTIFYCYVLYGVFNAYCQTKSKIWLSFLVFLCVSLRVCFG